MFIPFVIPRTRKGLAILFAVFTAIVFAGAIITYFSWAADQKMLRENGQPDFNTLSQEQLKNGLIVQGKIMLSFDTYAEAYETNMGIRSSDKSTQLYYIIPVYDVSKDNSIDIKYFITFMADPKHFDTMDKIVTQTWSDVSEVSELDLKNAQIRTLPSNVKQYLDNWANANDFYERGSFIDWCAEYGVFGTADKTAIQSRIVPFMMTETAAKGTDLSTVFLLLGIGLLFLAVTLFLIFFKRRIKGLDPPSQHASFEQSREMSEGSKTQ